VSVDVTFVSDGGKHTTGYGRATTKKDAEKLAALDALIKLKKQKESAPTTTPAEVQGKNPKAQLNELYQKLWKTCPHYKFNHSDGMYIAEVQVEDSVFLGKGGSKATASVEAARSALAYLAQTKPLTRCPPQYSRQNYVHLLLGNVLYITDCSIGPFSVVIPRLPLPYEPHSSV